MPDIYVEILNKQDDLSIVANENEFIVFENRAVIPHLSAFDSLFQVIMPPEQTLNSTKIDYSTGELCLNSDFEEGFDFWDPYWHGKQAVLTNVTCFSGDHSVKIERPESEGWAGIKQSFRVEGEVTYMASLWVKTENVFRSHAKLVWYDTWNASTEKPAVRQDFFSRPGIVGTTDWIRMVVRVKSPPNATRMDFVLLGGSSHDKTMPGITWFDEISFKQGYVAPYVSASPLSAIEMLSYLPNFSVNKQLLVVTQQQAFWEDSMFDVADVIVSIGNVTSLPTNLGESIKIILMDESETSLVANSGCWVSSKDVSASNGYVLHCKGLGEAVKKFLIPREEYYKIGVRGSREAQFTLKVDGIPLDVNGNERTQDKFIWFETKSINLEQGWHNMTVICSSEKTTFDEIVIFSVEQEDNQLKGVFDITLNQSFSLISRRINPTEYQIEITSAKPLFLFFGESFHPSWNARVNGEELRHFKVYDWANGFYLDKVGNLNIQITFDEQNIRNQIINLWALFCALIMIFVVYTRYVIIARTPVWEAIMKAVRAKLL